MAQDPKKTHAVDDLMSDAHSITADDPDMIAKLNEIALKVAEAQGKKPASTSNAANIATDPMNELGCEGCQ